MDTQSLIEALTNKNPKSGGFGDVRIIAARQLGELGPKAQDAVPHLEKLTKDKDPAVRQAAQDALAKIKAG